MEHEAAAGLASDPVALRRYAGAMVRRADGYVLCQLRDANTRDHPRHWCSAPGGRLRMGEAPEAGVRRELREEFGIEVSDLAPLLQVRIDGPHCGAYYVFSAQLATPSDQIRCFEGDGFAFLTLSEVLALAQHPVANQAARVYEAGTTHALAIDRPGAP